MVRKTLLAPLLAFASRLRFPTLLVVTAVLFVIDLAVPDFIPMIDEVMLGLATVLLASWRKRKQPEESNSAVAEAGEGTDRPGS